ncbi:ATP-binding protein [Pseudoduganella ginsengisoli]|nr:ATP-binding protein [Pseudoduganella ginsengisoli]
MIDASKETETEILEQVKANRTTGEPVRAVLKTDERVFARITDGIYREPASALRELIANAYDADATSVHVITDAPRFSRIIIRDNGHGLTEEALVHVICHIGGSLKRSSEGSEYNVVSPSDRTRSPGGRKLIGKLGIGLFSVSQLTHRLTIVTKVKNENVRRVCEILLMPQRDDQVDAAGTGEEKKYVTGKVQIHTVLATDLSSQGTEITLHEIRPFVRESLQSASLWAAINPEPELKADSDNSDDDEPNLEGNGDDAEDDFVARPVLPTFHIGQVSQREAESLILPAKLPWDKEDSPEAKFRKLLEGLRQLDKGDSRQEKIKLSDVLDTYFRTIWTLSLSIPVSYIDKHPFSLSANSSLDMFALSNKSIRPKPVVIELEEGFNLRDYCSLSTPDNPSEMPFDVYFDGLLLRRPLSFNDDTTSLDAQVGRNLLFVGKIKSDMTSLPAEYSGGPLELEAYYYWQPRIVPSDHNGVMVRIHGASGIMFDDQFFKYQVSEQNRLGQITAEIFVLQGLDSALNIDRESFNIAHPHYQFMRKWVHHSLRQMVSKQKALTKGVRDLELTGGLEEAKVKLDKLVVDRIGRSPQVRTDFVESAQPLDFSGAVMALQRSVVFAPRAAIKPRTKSEKLREALFEEKIKAVADVLRSYGVLDKVDLKTQEEMLQKIVEIFTIDIK